MHLIRALLVCCRLNPGLVLLVLANSGCTDAADDGLRDVFFEPDALTLDVQQGQVGERSAVLANGANSERSFELETTADWLTVEPQSLIVAPEGSVEVVLRAQCDDNLSHSANVTVSEAGRSTELLVTVHCWGGPLTIDAGGTYSGNWSSDDGAVPAVLVKTKDPVVLEQCRLRGRGPSNLIDGVNVDLTVRDCHAFGLRPRGPGYGPPRFLRVTYPTSVVIEHNWIEGASTTVYVENGKNPDPVERILVRSNQVRNIDGRVQPNGGCTNQPFISPDRAGTSCAAGFVSFNRVDGAEIEIAWNEVINRPYESSQDVIVSTINSSGTADRPIRIHDNLVRGQYPADPATEESFGAGIIAADGTDGAAASQVSKHVWVYDNHVISVVKGGIGTVAGNTQRIFRNRVVSSGKLPDGRPFADSGRSGAGGIVIWDCCYQHREQGIWRDIEVFENVVGWATGTGEKRMWGHVGRDHCTTGPDGASQCFGNTELEGEITHADEDAEFERWKQKVKDQNVVLGPRDGGR